MTQLSPRDQRKHPRRKGFWRAIAFLAGHPPLHCVVRNISEGGALLEFARRPRFPNRFRLYVEQHDIEYHCEVRHQGDYGVGVYFFEQVPCQPQDYLGHFGRRTQVPSPAITPANGQ